MTSQANSNARPLSQRSRPTTQKPPTSNTCSSSCDKYRKMMGRRQKTFSGAATRLRKIAVESRAALAEEGEARRPGSKVFPQTSFSINFLNIAIVCTVAMVLVFGFYRFRAMLRRPGKQHKKKKDKENRGRSPARTSGTSKEESLRPLFPGGI